MNHQFIPRLTLPVSLALALLLLLPTLAATAIGYQQQNQLTSELAQQTQKLQAHRQAAETILARQRSFARTSAQQQQPQQLAALSLFGSAWRDDIALLSLELDVPRQRIRVEIAAHSLDAVLDFVSRLQNGQTRVGLEHHQSEKSLPEPWKTRATLNLEYSDAS